jgi:hypothetical protein
LQVCVTLALKFGHINCQETFLTKMQGGLFRAKHSPKAAIFQAIKTFLDTSALAEFPERKKDVGKGNGHQGQPVR